MKMTWNMKTTSKIKTTLIMRTTYSRPYPARAYTTVVFLVVSVSLCNVFFCVFLLLYNIYLQLNPIYHIWIHVQNCWVFSCHFIPPVIDSLVLWKWLKSILTTKLKLFWRVYRILPEKIVYDCWNGRGWWPLTNYVLRCTHHIKLNSIQQKSF